MSNLSTKSLIVLCRDCERFNAKVLKLAWKIRRNPHRGDYILSVEETAMLKKEQDALLKRMVPFETEQERFHQLMRQIEGLLKSLQIITMAQKELHDKLEQQAMDKSEKSEKD